MKKSVNSAESHVKVLLKLIVYKLFDSPEAASQVADPR